MDTKSVLIAFTQVLPEYFLEGATIELGDLGYFQTSMQSNGAVTAEEFTSDMIKGFSVSYRATSKVKEQYKNVKYTKLTP